MREDPLEPSREDFARRDAAGLCVACGQAPQPPRKDPGDHPTQHRCDACWRVYQRLRTLRSRLLEDSGWTFACRGQTSWCKLCGGTIAMNEYAAQLSDADSACWTCMEACGFVAAIADAVPTGPVLQHAAVTFGATPSPVTATERELIAGGKLPPFVVLRFPPAIPALLGFSLKLLQLLAKGDVQGGCSTDADAVGLTAIVQPGSDPFAARDLVATMALGLARFATRVEVPPECYRLARQMVYDKCGNPLARRVTRARVQ